MNRLPVILTALVLAACSDSTGVDEIPNIDGSWTYNLTFTSEGSTCTYDPSPVTINQVGATFTGRIDIPDATCTYQGGDPYSLGSWGADIENGTGLGKHEMPFDSLVAEAREWHPNLAAVVGRRRREHVPPFRVDLAPVALDGTRRRGEQQKPMIRGNDETPNTCVAQ